MKSFRSSLIAPTLALILATSLNAEQLYTVEEQSLKEAIEQVSKQSNIPYMVNGKLLEGKKAPKIKDVKGVKKALEKLLKGTSLEATIEDGTILIKKKKIKETSFSNSLGEVEVIERASNTTEGTGSYTIESMNTATKLNLSIKDTPQSVIVVTNQEIKDKSIQEFTDLTNDLVGFNSPRFASDRFFITARGFDVDTYKLDGVPTSYAGDHTTENLAIYDRVEIVRGANGLTTGSGEPSASINMVRKHANSKEFKGDLTLKAGSWNTYSGMVDLSIPLTKEGDIRSRFVAQKEDKDSFLDYQTIEQDTFYGIVDADISDQTKISLGASYINKETQGSNQAGVPSFFSDGTRTNFSEHDSFAASWAGHDKKSISYFTNFEHIFLNDIKINASYLYHENDTKRDVFSAWGFPDKTTGLGLEGWSFKNYHKTKTNALDLYSSIPFELASQNHEVIIGAIYSKKKEKGVESDGVDIALNQSVYSWDGNKIPRPYDPLVKSNDSELVQSALYLAGRFQLLDSLKLIAGARISNYKYSCENGWSCPKEVEHKNEITPYAGLVYDINENHSAYISYTSIFKPDLYARDISNNFLDPTTGNNYELGIKGEYFDKRLNAGLTYFKIEQKNAVESTNILIPGTTDFASESIDGVTSKGIEVSVKGDITENWNVDFGVSIFTKKDRNGEKLSTTIPRKEVSLSTKYKFGKLSLGGGVSWSSKLYTYNEYHPSYSTNKEASKITQDAIYLVNAMAKYDFTKDLSLQLNVNNLFDKKYISEVAYDEVINFGTPRKTTLTLNYKF